MPFQEENEDIRGPQITKEYCLRRAFRILSVELEL